MKKIIHFALFLLCTLTVALFLASCNENEEDNTPEKSNETIIMFFPYSGLENSISQNIDSFKDAIITRKGLGNNRLVVFQAKNSQYARLYEIIYDNGSCIEQSLQESINISFESNNQYAVQENIQRILQIIKHSAESESYSMIIGCHGAAWLPAGTHDLNKLNSRSFGTSTSNFQIDNTTLATALLNEGIHLNYILFDACFMANIETIYEYQEVCDYYISSPTEILSYGMPYNKMADALIRHNYDEAVKAFYDFYSNTSTPYATISVTDCRYIADMAAIMKNINAQNDNISATEYDLQPMEGLTQHVFFDFSDYVNSICKNPPLLEEFNNTLDLLVPYKYNTQYFYSVFSKKTIALKNYCGLSISEPTANSIVIDDVKNTPWYIATH